MRALNEQVHRRDGRAKRSAERQPLVELATRAAEQLAVLVERSHDAEGAAPRAPRRASARVGVSSLSK